eukprot:9134894-Alexandrium_andersonii.AAC.1
MKQLVAMLCSHGIPRALGGWAVWRLCGEPSARSALPLGPHPTSRAPIRPVIPNPHATSKGPLKSGNGPSQGPPLLRSYIRNL